MKYFKNENFHIYGILAVSYVIVVIVIIDPESHQEPVPRCSHSRLPIMLGKGLYKLGQKVTMYAFDSQIVKL